MTHVNGLHASKQDLATLTSPDYWRKVCPGLHVNDSEWQTSILAKRKEVTSRSDCADVRTRLLEDGYSSLPPTSFRWTVETRKLADGILALETCGWPATFISIYDEAWVMALDASEVMKEATGNEMCMDVVGFIVRPEKSKGFSPHRDRQPEDWQPRGFAPEISGTFKADGMARY